VKCVDLATTGSPLAAILILAAACLLVGVAFVLVSRAGRSRSTNAIVLLLLASAALAVSPRGSSSARAAPAHCTPDAGSGVNADVTITQTAVITGLAPGIGPEVITGIVANRGGRRAYVTAITVSITAVTKAIVAAAGPCDASDFVLADVTMAVNVLLTPGRSTGFGGASIGFNDKSVNQDACKSATITLHYVSR